VKTEGAKTVKTGEASKLLGVDPKTIVNWIDRAEFNNYFSPTARKEGISQRMLTDNDMAILNTIRHATVNERASWADIAAIIESGALERDIPLNAGFTDTRVIPEQQARELVKAAGVVGERDQMAMQLAAADQRIAELEQRLADEQSGRREDVERLHREIAAAQVAQREAEVMVRLYEQGRLKPPGG
jgi:DNA-binding transcriptional MerR regulator